MAFDAAELTRDARESGLRRASGSSIDAAELPRDARELDLGPESVFRVPVTSPRDLSRRDVLAGFLGVPVALAACRTRGGLPPGELVHRAEILGHRVRDGVRVAVESATRERVPVVIVGAGVAGLSAAWRLARAGFDRFAVIDLEDAPGGTAMSGAGPTGAYPWGAHYVTVPMQTHRAMVRLLDEMHVLEGRDPDGEPIVAEQFLCREPSERVFADGAWHEGLYLRDGASPDDLAQLARFQREMERWAAWRDGRGRRAFAIPTAHASDDAEVTALDRLSMRAWMDAHGFTSRRLRWLVDYACRDDFGSTPDDTSAWAGVFYFASRIEREGAEAQAVITWPEGNGRLVAHLHAAVRDCVRLGLAAVDIAPVVRDGGAGVDVAVLARDGSTRVLEADQVIFAGPRFVLPHVVRPYRAAPPQYVTEFVYGAWMVANVSLVHRPRSVGFAPAWDNVFYDSPSLGYVTNTHQQLRDHGPTTLTYYYPLCDHDPRVARRRLLSAGRDEWADVALSDLARAHPEIRSLATRLDVVRWGHAMVRPRPGFVWNPARIAASAPDRGIHFAHTDLSGLALFEEAFDHGIRAAEEVLAARRVTSESFR